MPHSQKIAQEQMRLFTAVFAREFLQEFQFLVGVEAKRNPPRLSFADKLKDVLKQIISTLPLGNAVNVGTNILGDVAKQIIDSLGQVLQEAQIIEKTFGSDADPQLLNQQSQWDPEAFRWVIEAVAREIAQRYEFFITYRLSAEPLKGIVPFAKTGVGRCLRFIVGNLEQYQAANHGLWTKEYIKQGLFKGVSGKLITSWRNTSLEGQPEAPKHLTAEGAYARSAFYTPAEEKTAEDFWILPEKSRVQKVIDAIKDMDAEESHQDGVNFTDKAQTEPKYGYAIMSRELCSSYGYISRKPGSQISTEWQSFQKQRIYRYITAADINSYLDQLRSPKANQKKWSRFNDYIAQEDDTLCIAVCHEDLSGISLAGGDFSDVDFSEATISGDLNDVCFDRAFCFGTKFQDVRCDRETPVSFHNSILVFSKLKGSIPRVDLTQAQLSFADLTNVQIDGAQTKGAQWYGTKLTKGKEKDIEREQEIQSQKIKELAQKQEEFLRELAEKHQQISEAQAALQQIMDGLESQLESKADKSSVDGLQGKIEVIREQVEKLLLQQEACLSFEGYCRDTLGTLMQEKDKQVDRIKYLEKTLLDSDQRFKNSLDEISRRIGDIQEISQQMFDELRQKLKILNDVFEKSTKALAEEIKSLAHRVDGHDQQLQHHSERLAGVEEKHQELMDLIKSLQDRLKQGNQPNMLDCIFKEKVQYDPKIEFASYTVEKADGSRFCILQFVQGDDVRTPEQFLRYSLRDTVRHGAGERDFQRRKMLLSREDVEGYLAEEGTHYSLIFISKKYLERIRSMFDSADAIRASGLAQAINKFFAPITELTGTDFNPVNMTLTFAENIAAKKAEGRYLYSAGQ